MKAQIAEAVIERAGGYCETCGGSAQVSMALHHRKLKSRGGKDSVSNLIWVHHSCHNLGTDSIHLKPALAQSKGWIVPSWADPEKYPFLKPNNSLVLLREDGTMTSITEQEGEQNGYSNND